MITKKHSILRPHCGHNGFILLMSVLIMAATAVSITVALLLLGTNSSRTSFARAESLRARALADACAEEALQQIHDSSLFAGTDSLILGHGSCDYTVTILTGENRTVNAIGTVGDIVRKVDISLDDINPNINITSWQEVSDF